MKFNQSSSQNIDYLNPDLSDLQRQQLMFQMSMTSMNETEGNPISKA